MAAQHTTPNLSGLEQQLFYLQRFCPSIGLRWVILLLHVIMAASAGIWGYQLGGTFKMAQSYLFVTLAGLTRKLDSAGIHRSLNLSCCASPITWQLRTPQSTRGNELAFLKLKPSIVISVPFYWQGTLFLICQLWPYNLCPMLACVRMSTFLFLDLQMRWNYF